VINYLKQFLFFAVVFCAFFQSAQAREAEKKSHVLKSGAPKVATEKSHATKTSSSKSKSEKKKPDAAKLEEVKIPKSEESKTETPKVEEPKLVAPKASGKAVSQKLWYGISSSDLEVLKKVFVAIERQNYDEALRLAPELKHQNSEGQKVERPDFYEAVRDIILWNKFGGKIDVKKTSFSDISRFVNDNPFYPNLIEIRRNAEKVAISNNIPYQSSEQYFNSNPATTPESKVYLLQSKINFLSTSKEPEDKKEKERQDVKNMISNIWTKENFSEEEEKNFLEKYRDQLSEVDHINRIERLLWENKNNDAKRLFALVSEDYRALFNAIITLQDSPKFIDPVVFSVPRKLRNNEGLVYRRILWYKSKDQQDNLIELMLELPKDSRFADKWWSLRRLYAREMIKQKKYKVAYELVSGHNLPKTSSDFWEAEWTAGWISLRFLDKPKEAYKHFDTLYKNVSQPVTLARAAYWLGMASQAMNNDYRAIEWYKEAAKYPIFFYGQLAIHKHRSLDPIGAQDDIILPKDPDVTGRDIAKISESRAAQIAYLLAITGDKTNATKIFEWLVNTAPTEGQIAVVMRIINEIGDRQLDARISRVAAKKNVFFIKDKFQIVKEVSNDEYAPLVHAIIKQESGFAPTAVSQVGAIGFMQLMPTTAKLVAKDMGIKYDNKLLATDITYNVRLGSHYIKKLIDRFDGSEMLAIASYNAGPNATQRWINEFYDPRKEKDLDKVIDWIELITYSETRNYVQRIMENLIVYKYLMSRSNYDSVR
jgi:soluble lytic murein transglycosylase